MGVCDRLRCGGFMRHDVAASHLSARCDFTRVPPSLVIMFAQHVWTIDDESYSLPTGCAGQCATLFHRVSSLVLVSTDQRTSLSSFGRLCPSSGFLPFPLFIGFGNFPKNLVSAFPSAFAGESGTFHIHELHLVLPHCAVDRCQLAFQSNSVLWRLFPVADT